MFYHFIDPQGILHGNYWFYHRNYYTTFFDGDPTVWEHYQIIHILPQGSAPGRWGLGQMTVSDKAANQYTYIFVETLIFEPDDDMSKYILFADMDDSDMLYLTLTSESGTAFGYNYRVIHSDQQGGGPNSVSGITAQHNKIVLNGRTVTVFSTSEGFITIATIDGTQRIQPVVNGKTTFELPQAGLYIIDGRKFIVR